MTPAKPNSGCRTAPVRAKRRSASLGPCADRNAARQDQSHPICRCASRSEGHRCPPAVGSPRGPGRCNNPGAAAEQGRVASADREARDRQCRAEGKEPRSEPHCQGRRPSRCRTGRAGGRASGRGNASQQLRPHLLSPKRRSSGAAGHPDAARASTRVTQCRPVLPCRIWSRWTKRRSRPGMRWRKTFQGGSDAASACVSDCLPQPEIEQCVWPTTS